MTTLRLTVSIIYSSIYFLTFNLAYAATPPMLDTSQAIRQGETFLLRSLANNTYTLACTSSNSVAFPCPIHQKGEIAVGFFVLQALADQDLLNLPATISNKIIAQLAKDKKNAGDGAYNWGYANNAPPDADDTSFGLQTLFLLGKKIELNGLEKFYRPTERGYSAFLNKGDLYPDVNANVFLLFQRLNLDAKVNEQLIKAFQHRKGYWNGHFYQGKYYTTHLAMKVLCRYKPSQETRKGVDFILKNQHLDGSWGEPGNPYDTALALSTLLVCDQPITPAVSKGIKYLIKNQLPDGSWRNEQAIWRCLYTEASTDDVFWAGYDNSRATTTAFAVYALKNYRENSKSSNNKKSRAGRDAPLNSMSK